MCVPVVFEMKYESKELGEMQGVGHRRKTDFGSFPLSVKLTLAEAAGNFFPTAWGAGYSVSCTNTAQGIPTWLSFGLTAALELPQGCTELKNNNLSIPAPCPSRLPEILETERYHSSTSLHPPTLYLSIC